MLSRHRMLGLGLLWMCALCTCSPSQDPEPRPGASTPDASSDAGGTTQIRDASPPVVPRDSAPPENGARDSSARDGAVVMDAAPHDSGSVMDAAVHVPAWTVLVYMAADNNLEKYAIDDLNEMLLGKITDDM